MSLFCLQAFALLSAFCFVKKETEWRFEHEEQKGRKERTYVSWPYLSGR